MPFKSEKQRRYLWKFEPKVAKTWAHESGSGNKRASVMKKKSGK